MTNFLEETMSILAEHKKTVDDIEWVGSRAGYIDLKDFIQLADCKYDSGFGAQHVASDLIIVGANWWLEREEYDGAENWVFHSVERLIKPKNRIRPERVIGGMWNTLSELNGGFTDDEETQHL